jgi:urease accessory protein
MDTRTDWLPLLLQNSDSLFPTGGYAHSSGLEEIVRLGLVCDEASLKQFLREQLMPALENLELPYVRAAYEAGRCGDLEQLKEISAEIDAWKLCREAREASLQMGRARWQVARKVFPHPLLEALSEWPAPPHQAAMFGWQMGVAGVPLEAALSGYFYLAATGAGSAALKLIRIGQEGVQRALRDVLAESEGVVSRALKIEREDAGWFSPVLEIAAMRHERADERLFIS